MMRQQDQDRYDRLVLDLMEIRLSGGNGSSVHPIVADTCIRDAKAIMRGSSDAVAPLNGLRLAVDNWEIHKQSPAETHFKLTGHCEDRSALLVSHLLHEHHHIFLGPVFP